MDESPDGRMTPGAIAALYHCCAGDLRRLVAGVVGDAHLAEDALQSAFTKAVERGGPDRSESAKAWLTRVAVNEALVVRRRQRVARRANVRLVSEAKTRASDAPVDPVARAETVRLVRDALRELPVVQQQVVRARIYEGKRFAQIASELGLPLGTVLTRMRRALERLRGELKDFGP